MEGTGSLRRSGRIFGAVVLAIAAVPIAGFADSPGGGLDPTFGDGGVVQFEDGDRWFTDIDVYPEGLAEGRVVGALSQPGAVARFLPDGTLDPEFGDHGVVEIEPLGEELRLEAIDSARAGGVLVAGTDGSLGGDDGGTAALRLIRLLPDGSLDPDFGDGGSVLIGAGLGRLGLIPEAIGLSQNRGILIAAGPTGETASRNQSSSPELAKKLDDEGTTSIVGSAHSGSCKPSADFVPAGSSRRCPSTVTGTTPRATNCT